MDSLRDFLAHPRGALTLATKQQRPSKCTPGVSVLAIHGSRNLTVPHSIGEENPTDDLFVALQSGQLKLGAAVKLIRDTIGKDHRYIALVENDIVCNPWVKNPEDAVTMCVVAYWDKEKKVKIGDGTSLLGENGICYKLIMGYHRHELMLKKPVYDERGLDARWREAMEKGAEKAVGELDAEGLSKALLQVYAGFFCLKDQLDRSQVDCVVFE